MWVKRWKAFALRFDQLIQTSEQGRIAIGRQCAAYALRLYVIREDREAIAASHFAKLAAPDLSEVKIVHGTACYLGIGLNPALRREAFDAWDSVSASDSTLSKLAQSLLTFLEKPETDVIGKHLLAFEGMPYPLDDFTIQLV